MSDSFNQIVKSVHNVELLALNQRKQLQKFVDTYEARLNLLQEKEQENTNIKENIRILENDIGSTKSDTIKEIEKQDELIQRLQHSIMHSKSFDTHIQEQEYRITHEMEKYKRRAQHRHLRMLQVIFHQLNEKDKITQCKWLITNFKSMLEEYTHVNENVKSVQTSNLCNRCPN